MKTSDAMVIERLGDLSQNSEPLIRRRLPVPRPGPRQVLIEVTACGVCHTELDEIEGRTAPPRLPVVPGHQVVGRVVERGGDAHRYEPGDRVGVAWIYSACGKCPACRRGLENLCADFKATGRDADGGYAGWMAVDEDFAYAIPRQFTDVEAAPLLCAGAIGYRSLALAGMQDGEELGLAGFGASAHLVLKMVRHRFPTSRVSVYARGMAEQEFARELGAAWAGDYTQTPPRPLDCVIDTTPAWKPVLVSLEHLRPGGRLVINAIRKEPGDRDELQGLDYVRHLWQEKEIKSVANVTRRDVVEFLELAAKIPLRPEVSTYPLAAANQALMELKQGRIRGAKVLVP